MQMPGCPCPCINVVASRRRVGEADGDDNVGGVVGMEPLGNLSFIYRAVAFHLSLGIYHCVALET